MCWLCSVRSTAVRIPTRPQDVPVQPPAVTPRRPERSDDTPEGRASVDSGEARARADAT